MGTFNASEIHLHTRLEATDGTTGDTNKVLFIAPADGFLSALHSVLGGTLGTNDAVLTIYINGTTTGVTHTLAESGSAAGNIAHTYFNKEVRENDIIKVAVTTADSTGRTCDLTISMVKR